MDFHYFCSRVSIFLIKMFHWHTSSRLCPVVVVFLALFLGIGHPKVSGQEASHSIDFFSGVDFNFKDMDFETQYKFLIRLTPGFKWNFGNHWQVTGQMQIPIVNQYGTEYSFVELRTLNISKEFNIKSLYLKASVGAFTQNRYGVDLKAFLPLCDWFAFEGQAGYVGSVFLFPYWEIVAPNRFVGTIGGDFYLPRWNTQFRGIVGKYLYDDIGVEGEVMRHFNHATVSVYSRWSNKFGFDGGFKVIIMLPPYRRIHRVVNIRPASNFRLAYTVMYRQWNNKMYYTDPEQNERDGWFSRDLLHWGSHNMEPDFIIKERTKK